MHPSSGDGLSDVSGAAPECESPSVSQLPSAADFGFSASDLLFQLDYVDFDCFDSDLVQDTYFAASGFVDPLSLSSSSNSVFDLDLLDDSDVDSDPIDPAAHSVCSILSTTLPDPDMAFLDAYNDTLDPGSRALYALDFKLREMKIPRSQFYQQLRAEEASLGPSAPARAHMDGGAMASTTDCLDLLWHVTSLDPSHRPPVLHVANDHNHAPVAVGYLCIPTQ